MKILIKGYYGFGNLGDDVLMITSYNLIKDIFPNAEILIFSNSPDPSYIHKYLKETVQIINFSSDMEFDLILHGGGGVHYDFKKGDIKHYFINVGIKVLGYKLYSRLFLSYKKIRHKPRVVGDIRVGMGIGVGTFTSSSKKFYSNIIELASYDLLFIRDQQSVNNLRGLKLTLNSYVSTDLAFKRDHWIPKDLNNQNNHKKGIGIILRDWSYFDHNHFPNVEELADKLESEGFQINFYSFDHNTDKQFINYFSKRFPVLLWNPSDSNLNLYLEQLKNEGLIITSRAHGAILGACLGIPAICIEIEPKLAIVANMLKKSASLIPYDFNVPETINLVKTKFKFLEKRDSLVIEDYELNNRKITNAVEILKTYMRGKGKNI